MKRMKKTLALILVLCTLLACLSSCTRASEKDAVRYGDYAVSRAIFEYLCCLEKTNYLYEAYGVTSDQITSSELQDNPQIWIAQSADGVTVGDALKMQVLEKVQLYLYLCQYAKDEGRELNEEQIKAVSADFAALVKRNFTDKKTFNKSMEPYGINYDQMLQYKLIESLAVLCEDLLFGEKGAMRISEDSAKKYFNANFMTLECIFINTKNKTFPNGKVVALPAEEKAEKEALADEVFAKLEAGEDFATLCGEHSDQVVTEDIAKNGYTFEKGSFFASEVEEKALELGKGTLGRVETENGVYLFRQKTLNASHFEESKDEIITLLENAKKASLVADAQGKFKLDDDFLESINVADLNHVV